MAGWSFLKLEGCGNSFVVSDLSASASEDLGTIAKKVCDRNFGVGADGLLLVGPINQASSVDPIEVRMLNPDGTLMGMCGNGIRCVCRYLVLRELITASQTELRFLVEGRLISCQLEKQGRVVRVAMGQPAFRPDLVPCYLVEESVTAELELEQRSFVFSALSVGNPHCVIFVTDLEKVELDKYGPLIEHHPLFPKRTNVEFVQLAGPEQLRVKVWERGAGATLACGTGACAAVVAGVRQGLCRSDCQVELPGGVLEVEWQQHSNQLFLRGPAREICQGQWLQERLS